MSEYHVPVLLEQSVAGLNIKPDGIYVDVTFGGGGHSKRILEDISTGRLIGMDQDPDAAANAEKIENRSFTFIQGNFRYVKKYLKAAGISEVDGILGDLGISSFQIDEASRGFTFRNDAPLDMRMNKEAEVSAEHLVNELSATELKEVFSKYGELPKSGRMAERIAMSRLNKRIVTSNDLIQILEPLIDRNRRNKTLAQVFQALRIAVNDEMQVLRDFLTQSTEMLAPKGRLVVISYHSLEDRLVKQYINSGNFEGAVEKDIYGNINKPLDGITRKPIVPDDEEIARNPRSRSAKLRIAEKK